MKLEERIREILQRLSNSPRSEVTQEFYELAGSLAPDDVPSALALLQNPDPEIRSGAILLHGKLRDPRAVAALARCASDEHDPARTLAISELASTGDPAAVDPLLELLRDPGLAVRYSVVLALRHMRDPRVIAALSELARSADQIGYAAAASLTEMGGDALDRVLTLLHHPNVGLRQRMVRVLQEVRDPRAVEPLSIALEDDDADVSWFAFRALAQVDSASAAGPLRRAGKVRTDATRDESGRTTVFSVRRAAERLAGLASPGADAARVQSAVNDYVSTTRERLTGGGAHSTVAFLRVFSLPSAINHSDTSSFLPNTALLDLYPIVEPVCTLGRTGGVDVWFPLDPAISRHQARILTVENRRCMLHPWDWIQQRPPRNGVFLNGKNVAGEEPHLLQHGDVIRIGDTLLRFEQLALPEAER